MESWRIRRDACEMYRGEPALAYVKRSPIIFKGCQDGGKAVYQKDCLLIER